MKTRFTRFALRFAVLAVVLTATSTSLHATTNQSGCATGLIHCYNTAANLSDWISRSAAAFDCQVDFAGCVRNALLGN
jgi:dissimilatory sulfite reductase (desulfoviridin) alpha/beta subunit